jgi:hypothetical protein
MTTALNLIEGAARILGVLNKGENMPADDAADGLVALNDLLASWSNESLLVYARTLESFTLTGGVATYLIGSGQTFNTTRPVAIVEAVIRDSSNVDYPLTIINEETYQGTSYKTTQTPIPEFLSYTNAHPYGTINLYGTPSQAYSLRLLTEKPLTSFSLTSTTVDLPPGWNRALRYNLALELAPEYSVKVDQLIVKNAMDSKGAIKAATLRNRPLLSMDAVDTINKNIYTGWF